MCVSSIHESSMFFRDNPDIIITRAEKGNFTVTFTKNEYTDKINKMLQDHNTYTLVKKNPIRDIENNLRDLLNRWKSKVSLTKISETL